MILRGYLWELGFADFLIVTLILGGGAAFMTGRAIAASWEPWWHAGLWMVPLAGAVRFIHFVLFHGTLLSLRFYLVDLVVLLLFSALGYRISRTSHMTEQYPWMVTRQGRLSWRARSGGN